MQATVPILKWTEVFVLQGSENNWMEPERFKCRKRRDVESCATSESRGKLARSKGT